MLATAEKLSLDPIMAGSCWEYEILTLFLEASLPGGVSLPGGASLPGQLWWQLVSQRVRRYNRLLSYQPCPRHCKTNGYHASFIELKSLQWLRVSEPTQYIS